MTIEAMKQARETLKTAELYARGVLRYTANEDPKVPNPLVFECREAIAALDRAIERAHGIGGEE